jgi:hypothetical protein
VIQTRTFELEIGQLNVNFSLFYQGHSTVKKMGSLFKNNEDRIRQLPFAHFILYEDSSIAVLHSDSSTVDKLYTTVFPPPKAADIIEIVHSMSTQQLILLTGDGTIFFYSLDKTTAILKLMITGEEILDSFGKGFKTQITTLHLCNSAPPVYDKLSFLRQEGHTSHEGEYLALGLANGLMIIVSVDNPTQIVYRNQVAKSKIVLLRQVEDMYVVCSTDNMIAFFSLKDEEIQVHHEFSMFRPVQDVVVHN